jgi:hypothetical protein
MYGRSMSDDQGGTPQSPSLRDYVAWHDAYDDPSSSLSARLRQVQRRSPRGSTAPLAACVC